MCRIPRGPGVPEYASTSPTEHQAFLGGMGRTGKTDHCLAAQSPGGGDFQEREEGRSAACRGRVGSTCFPGRTGSSSLTL